MIKKVLIGIVNTISVIIIVFAILVLCTVVMTKSGDAPTFMGYSVFEVVSGSMEPTIGVNDMIVVKHVDASEVEVGDIISFYSSDPELEGAINTHRVTDITYENGSYEFTTKGDANAIEDEYQTEDVNLIGVVIFDSAVIGVIVHLLSNPLIFIPLIAIPLFLIVFINLRDTVRLAKKIEKEEQDEALRRAVEEIRRKKAEEENGEKKSSED